MAAHGTESAECARAGKHDSVYREQFCRFTLCVRLSEKRSKLRANIVVIYTYIYTWRKENLLYAHTCIYRGSQEEQRVRAHAAPATTLSLALKSRPILKQARRVAYRSRAKLEFHLLILSQDARRILEIFKSRLHFWSKNLSQPLWRQVQSDLTSPLLVGRFVVNLHR